MGSPSGYTLTDNDVTVTDLTITDHTESRNDQCHNFTVGLHSDLCGHYVNETVLSVSGLALIQRQSVP